MTAIRDWDPESKAALEDGDRTAMLAKDARALLWRCDCDPQDWRWQAEFLMKNGPFSYGDALRILEFLQWEDARAK